MATLNSLTLKSMMQILHSPDAPKMKVDIGCRWRPGLVVFRRDVEQGAFEAVNPMIESHALGESERLLQVGLLKPVVKPWIAARIEAIRVARSPKTAPVIEYRVCDRG